MFRSRVTHSIAGICALAVIGAITALLPEVYLTRTISGGNWFSAVHLYTNEFHTWRFDHVSRLFPELSAFGKSYLGPLGGQLIILVLGSLFVLHRLNAGFGWNPALLWVIAILTTLSITLLVGQDPVVLGSIAWFPAMLFVTAGMLAVCRSGLEKGAVPLLILLLFVSLEGAASANHVAPIIAVATLLIAAPLAQCMSSDTGEERRTWIIPVLVLLVPALVSSASTPPPPIPDYPALAHVVTDDGLEGIPTNLVGPDYPIAIIDRPQAKAMFGTAAFLLAGVAGALALYISRSLTYAARAVLLGGAAILFSAALDTLPDTVASIFPIMTASRLIPWGPGLCLLPLALALGALLVSFATAASRNAALSVLWLATLFASSATTGLVIDNRKVDRSFEQLVRERWDKGDDRTRDILASPSLAVMRFFHSSTPALDTLSFHQGALESATLTPLPRDVTITTLPASLAHGASRLADGKPNSRWSTHTGRQVGGETVQLSFSSSTVMYGLDLSPGPFATDFPRGLLIQAGESCTHAELPTVASFPSWQGSLKLTPLGFPYFSGQESVRVFFGKPVTAQCLRVTQTGSAPYDWSLAEVSSIDLR